MLKYVDTDVTFQEVPGETTLCINISNCPCHCEGCHSPHLAGDIGKPLNEASLQSLLILNKGVTCVCFMGGDSSPKDINRLAWWVKHTSYQIKREEPQLKVAWYSGRQELSDKINLNYFDFIKVGPYIQGAGGLNSTTTNQIFYEVVHPNNTLKAITYKFWVNEIESKNQKD